METKHISPVKHTRNAVVIKNQDFDQILTIIRNGSNLDMMSEVKKGLSRHVLDGLKDLTKLDFTSLSKVIGTTTATIHKKKHDDRFSLPVSEKIMEVAALYDFGVEVFEDKDDFNTWMQTENSTLGTRKPIEFIDTIFGINEVRNVIGRIQYGVYS